MTSSAAAQTAGSDILVIKHSALGDIVMALGAMQAIRRAHPDARLVLLTTPPYVALAQASGCFDEIWTDPRRLWWRFWDAAPLIMRLRARRFARVYDLQWSSRSSFYFRLLRRPGLEWVGVAPGCSHPYRGRRDEKHVTERLSEMLAVAGIEDVQPSDLSFLDADLCDTDVPPAYAMIVPGSAPNRLGKRWPLDRFIELCQALAARGLVPLLVCGPAEAELGKAISATCPDALFLATPLPRIAALARGATVAVGNDTGPMHLIGACGCPTVVLFGPESHPVKTKPLGRATVLQSDPLAELSVAEVLSAVSAITDDDGAHAAGQTQR